MPGIGCWVLHTAKSLGVRQEKVSPVARRSGAAAALLGGLILAACGTGTQPPPIAASAVGPAALTAAQITAVTAAARQMTSDPTATAHGLRGRANGPSTHVCGYVNSTAGPDTPLYVELRDTEGKVTAERGQTGATSANLAKVRFMCRRHGDW